MCFVPALPFRSKPTATPSADTSSDAFDGRKDKGNSTLKKVFAIRKICCAVFCTLKILSPYQILHHPSFKEHHQWITKMK
jgi:hypothetical protein